MNIKEQVAAKRIEIEKYEAIVDKSIGTRWYWYSRRHLDELKEQLKRLEDAVSEIQAVTPTDTTDPDGV